MKKVEKEKLIKEIWGRVYTKGIPVNVRNAPNSDVADWVTDIVDDFAKLDEPCGTETLESGGHDYLSCPICQRVVGASGNYCKWCGQLLRL